MAHFHPLTRALGFLIFAGFSQPALVACDSNADSVCDDIGNCSQNGDDDWITSCQAQAKTLSEEAQASGCGAAYDRYFSCAVDAYDCQGNKSMFAGCESQLALLESCLERGQAGNACGELHTRTRACAAADGGAGSDAGTSLEAGAGNALIEPCAMASVCAARCYLDNVPNVCSPVPAELTSFAGCAQQCIF
jgi:hypothetical protein